MALVAKDKDIVVPGDVLAEGMDFLPSFGTYRQENKILAKLLGLLHVDGKVLKIIPLSGRYLPKRNDIIIGKVIDITMNGWRVEINSPYTSLLGLKEGSFDFIQKGANLSRYYALDDHLVAKVVKVTSQNLVDLSCRGPGLRKLKGGRIIRVNTHKVPRIIGKKGSMVSMLKKATDCKIIVGQNGLVWIQGEPKSEILAMNTIYKIESESHLSGLTERIRTFLEAATGKALENIHLEEGGDMGEQGGEFENPAFDRQEQAY